MGQNGPTTRGAAGRDPTAPGKELQMRTMTLRAATVGAALVLLAAPAHASETADDAAEDCDVMSMPGGTLATYLDEDIHSPYLEEGNEWSSLTLTTEEGDTEIEDPGYGSSEEAYSPTDGGVIEEITLCQADPDAAGGADDESDEAAATEAPAEDDDSDDSDDESAGPAVETDGPLSASGPSAGLIGGGVLAAAGLGLVGYATLRRRDGHAG